MLSQVGLVFGEGEIKNETHLEEREREKDNEGEGESDRTKEKQKSKIMAGKERLKERNI